MIFKLNSIGSAAGSTPSPAKPADSVPAPAPLVVQETPESSPSSMTQAAKQQAVPATPAPATPAKPMGLGAFLRAKAAGNAPVLPTRAPAVAPIQAMVPYQHIEGSPEADAVEQQRAQGVKNFSDKLAKLDAMIVGAERLAPGDIAVVRGNIVEIMKDLKVYPEFAGILRAEDTHNLMVFVQSSADSAINDFKLGSEKKEKKESKRKAVKAFDLGLLTAPLDSPAPAKKGFSLDSMAGIDTDDIPTVKR